MKYHKIVFDFYGPVHGIKDAADDCTILIPGRPPAGQRLQQHPPRAAIRIHDHRTFNGVGDVFRCQIAAFMKFSPVANLERVGFSIR